MPVQRSEPLHGREIGSAEHADLAVRPRLVSDPVERIGPVIDLLEIGIPVTLGVIAPAGVLKNEGVTVLGRPACVALADCGGSVGVDVAHKQRWKAAFGLREVDVRGKADAVAHGHRYVVAGNHVLREHGVGRPTNEGPKQENEQNDPNGHEAFSATGNDHDHGTASAHALTDGHRRQQSLGLRRPLSAGAPR